MNNIPFNIPLLCGKEQDYLNEAILNKKLSGDGPFTKKCSEWFKNELGLDNLLTTSCTHALEIAAMIIDIKEGDEVIMPSYTFVSTANAFILRGAKIVFVDVRPDTMNIDEKLIEDAITPKTRAIVPVHYAGVACEMDTIMSIAKKHNLFVVEDAAQGMMSKYKDRALGTIGDIGCYSFHETKNYNCGEGGLVIIKDKELFKKAEIIREKGTNRSQFLRGFVDKYTWVDKGSSYLPSELNAAFLYSQLEIAEEVNKRRLSLWNRYYENLKDLNSIELPFISTNLKHNAHLFFIKLKDIEHREELINFLKENHISSVFHYIPLHNSDINCNFIFHGKDKYTTKESERLLRLPMYFELTLDEIDFITNKIKEFFND